jgi:hypothetical protein
MIEMTTIIITLNKHVETSSCNSNKWGFYFRRQWWLILGSSGFGRGSCCSCGWTNANILANKTCDIRAVGLDGGIVAVELFGGDTKLVLD